MMWFGPVLATIYLIVAVVLAIGLMRQRKLAHAITEFPPVSIVVAARNEQQDLPRCLASLDALSYDLSKLQILLVNDGSTDNTLDIMEQFAATRAHATALSVAPQFAHLPAKSKGLATGAALATGEWIFVTDADGAVPVGWIAGLLQYATPKTGVLGGPFVAEGRSCIAQLEMVVESYLMGVVFAIPGLGGTPIGMGPNMAIRRSIYAKAGGLATVSPDVAEDMALLKMAQSQGYICSGGALPSSTVRVTPVANIQAMLEQQKRWAVGGLRDAPAFIKFLVLLVGIYAWLGSVATLFGWLWSVETWAYSLILRATAETLIARGLARSVGLRLSLRQYVALQLYFSIAWLVVPAWAFTTRRATWRGAGYAEKL